MKKIATDTFDEHKTKRLAHKSIHALNYLRCGYVIYFTPIEATRYDNPLKRKFKTKRLAAEGRNLSHSDLDIFLIVFLVDGASAQPAPKRPAVQMPDEYLPPNKILFLQNLPESVTKDQLLGLFSQYALSFVYSVVC